MDNMANEKSPMLQSRKFVAFLVAEITWKVLAGLVLFWGKDSISGQVWALLLAIIVVAGFVEVLYIGNQAALDKYIKVAQIAADAGRALSMKGITIGGDPAVETPPKKTVETDPKKPGPVGKV
jgi:hypothetical protein